MLGMLIPFLILFACGLDRALKNFGNADKIFRAGRLHSVHARFGNHH